MMLTHRSSSPVLTKFCEERRVPRFVNLVSPVMEMVTVFPHPAGNRVRALVLWIRSGIRERTTLRGHHLPSQSSKSDESVDDTRRMTYTEESSIYDAYADSMDEKETSYSSDASHSQAPYDSPVSPTPTAVHSPEIIPPLIAEPEPEPFMQPQPQPALHQPQPQRHLTPVIQQHLTQSPSRTPSPDGSAASHHEDARRQGSPSTEYLPYHSPSPAVTEKRKGKGQEGSFGQVWSDR